MTTIATMTTIINTIMTPFTMTHITMIQAPILNLRLVPTVNSYGYTVASDVCKIEPMLFDQEDRSIYTRNTNKLNDNGIKEGWYQFTTGMSNFKDKIKIFFVKARI